MRRKTYFECVKHHSMGWSPGITGKERAIIFPCFLIEDRM